MNLRIPFSKQFKFACVDLSLVRLDGRSVCASTVSWYPSLQRPRLRIRASFETDEDAPADGRQACARCARQPSLHPPEGRTDGRTDSGRRPPPTPTQTPQWRTPSPITRRDRGREGGRECDGGRVRAVARPPLERR